MALLCTSIVPAWAHAFPAESSIRRSGERIAQQCIQSSKEKVKTTMNTVFSCKDLLHIRDNKAAAIPLGIPLIRSAKEIATYLVAAAITACKINHDCEQNAQKIVQGIVDTGALVYRFTGSKFDEFKTMVQTMFDREIGNITAQLLHASKQTGSNSDKPEAQEKRKAKEEEEKKRAELKRRLDQAKHERENTKKTRDSLVKKLKEALRELQQLPQTPRIAEWITELKKTIVQLQSINFDRAYAKPLDKIKNGDALHKDTLAIINKNFPSAYELLKRINSLFNK
jgi:Skp family chaperone for outer membrane proteins